MNPRPLPIVEPARPATRRSRLQETTPRPGPVVFQSRSARETRALGKELGRLLRGDTIIALVGPLGAGKTCLVQGLGRGLGVARRINSPSFVFLKRYQGRLSLSHWDWYRLTSAGDLESTGFGDLQVDRGVVVIEWADRFLDSIAPPFLLIEILPTGASSRQLALRVCGQSPELCQLLDDLCRHWTAKRKDHEAGIA